LRPINRAEISIARLSENPNSIKKESKKMQETKDVTNDKTPAKTNLGNSPAFKPSISIRRKQTRRIVSQVDAGIADLADEYVLFVSECHGYEVSASEVANEIYKSHFARDGSFKQWRMTRNKAASVNA
jgi:hypothetical protein